MKVREYRGPLTVLGAGVLGFSLFCIVAAAALNGPQAPNVAAIKPQSIVDSAFSNLSTMAALTVEVITQYVPTPTETSTPTPAPNATEVPTRPIVATERFVPPTKTRDSESIPRFVPTATPTPVNTAIPTSTSVPTQTSVPTSVPPTRTPKPTDTAIPPTDTPTPMPTDTATPVPPIDTPTPTPMDTPTPADTPTELPATDTPTPADTPTELPATNAPVFYLP